MKLAVVGIDPALANCGFSKGVYDTETGEIEISKVKLVKTAPDKANAKVVRKNSDDIERAKLLYDAIQTETRGAKFAFIEIPVGSQSARAMASYGICIGVIASCPIPFFQLTPSEVKLAAVGDKNASKDAMIKWAVAKHPDANWLKTKRNGVLQVINDNEHLADATAAIYAGVTNYQFIQTLALFTLANENK